MRLRSFGYLLLLLLVPATIGLFFFTSHLVKFVALFFQHSGIEISQDEIAAAYSAHDVDLRPQRIPKIIHQIYHDWHHKSMPEDWVENRQTCVNSNSGWEYMLWTEATSRDFIHTHFPWFTATYDAYPYPVQRVDTMKYFLMRHHGGIYLDLDNTCLTGLDPLLHYPTWVMDGGCGALSNNILGAAPNHPFWRLLTHNLRPYSYNYFFPYVTISYASGQWFVTLMWDAYHASLARKSRSVDNANAAAAVVEPDLPYRIRMDERPGMDHWVYFGQGRGGSWNSWDNVMFLWIGDHLILLGLFVFGVTALVLWMGTRLLSRLRRRRYRGKRYSAPSQDQEKDRLAEGSE